MKESGVVSMISECKKCPLVSSFCTAYLSIAKHESDSKVLMIILTGDTLSLRNLNRVTRQRRNLRVSCISNRTTMYTASLKRVGRLESSWQTKPV